MLVNLVMKEQFGLRKKEKAEEDCSKCYCGVKWYR
jgi:hypothetical protein